MENSRSSNASCFSFRTRNERGFCLFAAVSFAVALFLLGVVVTMITFRKSDGAQIHVYTPDGEGPAKYIGRCDFVQGKEPDPSCLVSVCSYQIQYDAVKKFYKDIEQKCLQIGIVPNTTATTEISHPKMVKGPCVNCANKPPMQKSFPDK